MKSDRERCQIVKKRMYLPDVDEYNSSSEPLTGLALEDVLSATCVKPKPLKHGYIADLTRDGGVSPCSLMLGLLYIRRLSQTNPKYLKTVSSRELFLIAMVIASKYMNDEGELEALTNSEWAELGCTPKPTLDALEQNFLEAIDWKLYVPLDEYYAFVTGMEGRIALRQASKRGWLTYTDLMAVWDATDIENSMLAASQQTAKVACGSAAVYLVCLATLFATSQSLQMASNAWNPNDTGVNLFSSLLPPETDIFISSGIDVTTNQSVECHPFPMDPHVHSMIYGKQSLDGNKSNQNHLAAEDSRWHVYSSCETCGFHSNRYFKATLLQPGSGGVNKTPHQCIPCAKHITGCIISNCPHRNTGLTINYSTESHTGFAHFVWKHADSSNVLQFNPFTPDVRQFNPSTPDVRQFNPSTPDVRQFNLFTHGTRQFESTPPNSGQFNPSTPPKARRFNPSTSLDAENFNPSTPPDAGQFNSSPPEAGKFNPSTRQPDAEHMNSFTLPNSGQFNPFTTSY